MYRRNIKKFIPVLSEKNVFISLFYLVEFMSSLSLFLAKFQCVLFSFYITFTSIRWFIRGTLSIFSINFINYYNFLCPAVLVYFSSVCASNIWSENLKLDGLRCSVNQGVLFFKVQKRSSPQIVSRFPRKVIFVEQPMLKDAESTRSRKLW